MRRPSRSTRDGIVALALGTVMVTGVIGAPFAWFHYQDRAYEQRQEAGRGRWQAHLDEMTTCSTKGWVYVPSSWTGGTGCLPPDMYVCLSRNGVWISTPLLPDRIEDGYCELPESPSASPEPR